LRILYIDIDTLRADHLGCYGYSRNTSPNIDRLAEEGVRFSRCYASDTPCLPSRTALCTGRFGYKNGVVGHGGTAADPFLDGETRGFWSTLALTSFAGRLARAGYHTATLSSFAQRHSAFHWHAGFRESNSVGKMGMETADEVEALALDWLARKGETDQWFLHVHYWDPHTPYRTPAKYGEPFAEESIPDWLTEEVRAEHWSRPGPHSAQECIGFSPNVDRWGMFPRQPLEVPTMQDVRRVFDGYDAGVRYADDSIGRLVARLDELGVLDDTAIIVSADHGETLGELGIYCDHQTADEQVAHVPMIVRWPELDDDGEARIDDGLHYQFDVMATILELAGGRVPGNWDGQSFAETMKRGEVAGRESLILSQAAWTCQRSVRFEDYLCMRTYHDGYHGFPDIMLYDVAGDPHEQFDLAEKDPARVAQAMAFLEAWQAEMVQTSANDSDPIATVMREGGPFHVRGELPAYLDRLRKTGRAQWADALTIRHARDAQSPQSR
jgi:arylsulfatase A-like enzyme